jgi:hypothetical protein
MERKPWEIIGLNLIPVIGYWFFNWSMFSIVYIFWTEAVIIAFYYALEKFLARGREPVMAQPTLINRFIKSVQLLAIRWGIMLFYWIFILVFIALGQGKLNQEDSLSNMKILVFQDSSFNIAVLVFALNGLLHLIQNFILTDRYKSALMSDYKSVFDSRTIIIHVVIVLGTFLHQYLMSYVHINSRLPGLGFVLILSSMKTIADLFFRKK